MTKIYCPNCGSKLKKWKQHCPFCGEKLPEIKKDPKKSYTDIAIVLDRSGSMEGIKEATIAGFNQFLEDQKKIKGRATISLHQFDNKHEWIYENIDIMEAPEMTAKTFVPRNTTALLDAIGFTINRIKAYINELSTKEKPDNVIIVIITDGIENASVEFSKSTINDMIKKCQDNNKWEFVYLGANQDAIATARDIHIPLRSAMTYSAKAPQVQTLFSAFSDNIGNLRGGKVTGINFSSKTRQKVMDDTKPYNITSTTLRNYPKSITKATEEED